MESVMTDRQIYIRTILDLYARMPCSAFPARRSDRALAGSFYDRGIPLDMIEAALLLGLARRLCRDDSALPLPAVRSLHYFKPIIEEVAAKPLPSEYIRYLRLKIDSAAGPYVAEVGKP
jgi:hypothetical protein